MKKLIESLFFQFYWLLRGTWRHEDIPVPMAIALILIFLLFYIFSILMLVDQVVRIDEPVFYIASAVIEALAFLMIYHVILRNTAYKTIINDKQYSTILQGLGALLYLVGGIIMFLLCLFLLPNPRQ